MKNLYLLVVERTPPYCVAYKANYYKALPSLLTQDAVERTMEDISHGYGTAVLLNIVKLEGEIPCA